MEAVRPMVQVKIWSSLAEKKANPTLPEADYKTGEIYADSCAALDLKALGEGAIAVIYTPLGYPDRAFIQTEGKPLKFNHRRR